MWKTFSDATTSVANFQSTQNKGSKFGKNHCCNLNSLYSRFAKAFFLPLQKLSSYLCIKKAKPLQVIEIKSVSPGGEVLIYVGASVNLASGNLVKR